MSPKIPVTRPCAAPCRRIDIVASRRVAAAWILWLSAVCAVLWFAVELPWFERAALCLITVSLNKSVICRCVLLQGRRAVRALDWTAQGEFRVLLGAARIAHPATLAAGSFRLGGLLVLKFETPGGMRAVLIDGGRQEIRAFRRLCRRLAQGGSGVRRVVPGVGGS